MLYAGGVAVQKPVCSQLASLLTQAKHFKHVCAGYVNTSVASVIIQLHGRFIFRRGKVESAGTVIVMNGPPSASISLVNAD